jgi:hypothetical protein
MGKKDKLVSELEKIKQEIAEMQNRMQSIFLNPTFAEIQNIEQAADLSGAIDRTAVNPADITLTKSEGGGFTLVLDNMIADIDKLYDLEFQTAGRTYLARGVTVGMAKRKFTKQENGFFSGKISSVSHLREFATENFHLGDCFYRYVLKAERADIFKYIISRGYCNEVLNFASGFVSLSIDGNAISLYETKFEDQKYFIIDSVEKMDFKVFDEITHSIMIGYGFLSGNFHQDEVYYIKAEDQDFTSITGVSYCQIRPSIISRGMANPIYAFASGYTKDPELLKRYGLSFEVFDAGLFSKLCSKIYLESEYAALLLLIIESNTATLILRPAGYSVALERITNIIAEENNGLKPIPDREVSRAFIAEVKKVLGQFEDRIKAAGNKDSIAILTKNIDGLNSPTNRDKLTKPFEIYGIQLSKEEQKAIGNRNSFLHGRSLDIEEGSEEYLVIYMNSLRLHKLVCKLILKHIGFSGYVVNHLKYNEANFDTAVEEDLFEFI